MKQQPSNVLTFLADVKSLFQEPHYDEHSLTIKVPPKSMHRNPRCLERHRTASVKAGASTGLEYLASLSEKSIDTQQEPTPPPKPPVKFTPSQSGRRATKMKYVESSARGIV